MVVVDVIVMFRYEEVSASVDDPLILPSVKVEPPSRRPSVTGAVTSDVLPQFVYDTRIDPKMRARMVENEMNEQAKLVQDLYQLRASRNTIEMEERKLHDLQVQLLLYMIFVSANNSWHCLWYMLVYLHDIRLKATRKAVELQAFLHCCIMDDKEKLWHTGMHKMIFKFSVFCFVDCSDYK